MPRLTLKNFRKVLKNIERHIADGGKNADPLIEELNRALDELMGQDYFGTEGQLDPRGDWRSER